MQSSRRRKRSWKRGWKDPRHGPKFSLEIGSDVSGSVKKSVQSFCLFLLKAPLSELVLQEMTSFIPDASALLKLDGSQPRELLEREKAIELMEKYIGALLKKDKKTAYWSLNGKGWKVCATVAASGMGKSALLETVASRQLQVKGRRVLYVTYNTPTFRVPETVLGRETPHGVACSLLWAAGAKEEDLGRLEDVSPKDAINFIRQKFEMNPEDALVVFVDELVQLGATAQGMLRSYMNLQESCPCQIAIVFSSFSTTQLSTWRSDSGRELYPVPLGVLDPQKVAEALAQEAKDAEGKEWLRKIQKESDLWKVVHGVAVHPRTAFTHLPRFPLQQDVELQAHISNLIFNNTKLEDHARALVPDISQILAKPMELKEGLDALLECGLIHQDKENGYCIEPFMIRLVAFMNWQWAGQAALRSALLSDLQVNKKQRVAGEGVVQNWEVVLRQGFGQDLVTLGELFRGAVCQRLPKKGFKLSPAKQPNHWIAKVGSFKEVKTVRKLLEAGSLVVSGNVGEAGIEHISPLFNEENKLVAALVFQVKSGTTPDNKGVRALIEAARKAGEKAVPKCQIIPVIMTNYEADTVDRKAVQLLGAGFHKWLGPLMPLRMIE